MTANAIHLHSSDNICVASEDLQSGDCVMVDEETVTVQQAIKMGHKVAIASVASGEAVRKYGQIIGFATQEIGPGDWVHSHNLVNGDFERDYAKCESIPEAPTPVTDRQFMGYRRADGRVGTRNYIAVISPVNCSASVAKNVAKYFEEDRLSDYSNVDGVIAFTHQSGCGMQYQGPGHQMLNRVLGGMAKHPNIGGYLLIGLGCEQGAMGILLQDQKLVQIQGVPAERQGPPVFVMQDLGGTAATIEAGIREVERLLPLVDQARREPCPASDLVLATECGGSDGNSGVTANPALGVAADRLVASGGTAILGETTEIYGAEHLLTRRARTIEVADKLLERIEWWKWYVGVFGAEIDNNPSVGNKAGGLTTITEKSLGAVAKGGTSTLEHVYEYAEQVTESGFVIMDTPGYDPASVTGMVAGGANVVVFTTGRGSCCGCKPSPSIKLATNTPMFDRMEADMDLNAGTVLQGESLDSVGERIFDMILRVASGEPTKSEAQGIGDEEFLPWIVGPTL